MRVDWINIIIKTYRKDRKRKITDEIKNIYEKEKSSTYFQKNALMIKKQNLINYYNKTKQQTKRKLAGKWLLGI